MQIKPMECYHCNLSADTYIGGFALCRFHAEEIISQVRQIVVLLPPEPIYNLIIECLVWDDKASAAEHYDAWLNPIPVEPRDKPLNIFENNQIVYVHEDGVLCVSPDGNDLMWRPAQEPLVFDRDQNDDDTQPWAPGA